MRENRFYLLTVFSLIAVLGYFTYQIFQPFLIAIAWAVVFCVLFYPLYLFALRYIRVKAIASLITLIVIVISIMGPFTYIAFSLTKEISGLMGKSGSENTGIIKEIASNRLVTDAIEMIRPYAGWKGSSAEDIINENAQKIGAVIVDKLSSGFTNLLGVAANFIIMLFTIFFLLSDGPGFLRRLRDYLPFSEDQKDRLALQTKDMIVSTIYGGVIVALVQGLLGGIAFAVLNIGSPILWGSVMSIVSFVPVFGTAIVWAPASIILLFEGEPGKGIAVILIGIFVISMADNILKPLIIGGRTKMPTIIIFFTVLGGIKFFGLLGLIMGPLVFALFLSVFEIFRTTEGGTHA